MSKFISRYLRFRVNTIFILTSEERNDWIPDSLEYLFCGWTNSLGSLSI